MAEDQVKGTYVRQGKKGRVFVPDVDVQERSEEVPVLGDSEPVRETAEEAGAADGSEGS